MSLLAQFGAFHDMASKAAGLDDFGPDDYREPMRLLLSEYDRHTRFNAIGIEMITGEIVGRLIGRLMTRRGLKQHPAAAAPSIVKPLIIFGMPRTGTTVLHRLIAEDPGIQSLPLWLGSVPMPRPPREIWRDNPWYRQIAAALEQAYALDPDIRGLHPMEADEPDECRFAIDHSFWAPDCASTAYVPGYVEWVLSSNADYAFRYYRQVLGLVGVGDGRRWVLKDVDHLFGLDALLDAFPDACVIQTHRDPVTALTSVASLIYRLRELREIDPDPIDHGKVILDTWAAAQNKAEKVRLRRDPARFIDIHNDDLHADPVRTVERIYEYFGLPITDEARAAWRRRVAVNPRSGHGTHRYNPADFGFSAAIVAASVGDYDARYRRVQEQRRIL